MVNHWLWIIIISTKSFSQQTNTEINVASPASITMTATNEVEKVPDDGPSGVSTVKVLLLLLLLLLL